MGLLTPLALLALGALAVPVWIHLSQRDRKEEVRFPSLMFLERIPYKAVRRQTIRNWPLFLLRSLVLILLVAAFARPFLGSGGDGVAGPEGPVDRVVLLDRSASMGAYGPLFGEIRTALYDLPEKPIIYNRTFGLGGREFFPDDIKKVFEENKRYLDDGKADVLFDYLCVRGG